MLLCRLFILAPLLFCFGPDPVLNQDVEEAEDLSDEAMEEEEPGSEDFFRKTFYNLRKMFFRNKHQNALSRQNLTEAWDKTLTQLSSDVNDVKKEFHVIRAEVSNVTAGLQDPDKDMIGRMISLGASGVSVFGDSLGVLDQIIKILTDAYQAFNRIGDPLFYGAERNYMNWRAMLSYVPDEIAAKLAVVLQQILGILNEIKETILAARDQIQIAKLQATINHSNAAVPLHKALVFYGNEITKIAEDIMKIILQVNTALVQIITNISKTTSVYMEGAIKEASKGLKQLAQTVKELQINISEVQKMTPQTTSAPPGSNQTLAATTTEVKTITPTAANEEKTIRFIATTPRA